MFLLLKIKVKIKIIRNMLKKILRQYLQKKKKIKIIILEKIII